MSYNFGNFALYVPLGLQIPLHTLNFVTIVVLKTGLGLTHFQSIGLASIFTAFLPDLFFFFTWSLLEVLISWIFLKIMQDHNCNILLLLQLLLQLLVIFLIALKIIQSFNLLWVWGSGVKRLNHSLFLKQNITPMRKFLLNILFCLNNIHLELKRERLRDKDFHKCFNVTKRW